MINEKGERVPTPKQREIPPHIEAGMATSPAWKQALRRGKRTEAKVAKKAATKTTTTKRATAKKSGARKRAAKKAAAAPAEHKETAATE